MLVSRATASPRKHHRGAARHLIITTVWAPFFESGNTELDAEGHAHARLLAQQITSTDQQQELFEPAASDEQRIAVRLDRVCIERGRSFGGVWLGWQLWRALKLDELCAELMPEGREAIGWAQMAAVLVIARLSEPASELHIAEDWYSKSALDDLLGLPVERLTMIVSTPRAGSAAAA